MSMAEDDLRDYETGSYASIVHYAEDISWTDDMSYHGLLHSV
ncbi:MAG: hypothetical protein QW810_08020 [Nitrososphaerota archaeon]